MQITADVRKSSKTFQFIFDVFQNHYLVLSHIRFSRLEKMLLVLQESVFVENGAEQQCVTMQKRFSTIMATILSKSF